LQNRLKAHGDNEGIEIVKEYSNLPLIECYSGQINQVLMNLIGNAIDELESISSDVCSYPKKIKISTECCHRGTIILRIADNGQGMTEDVKARLFEPFFTTKPVGKGTGLGLSISYQIVVEKHQGSIECISQPGEGTEFIIEIPVIQRQQEEITNELESVA
jgi:signal transduction histidine kinase